MMRKKKEKEYLSEEEFQSHISQIHELTYMFIGMCLLVIAVLSIIIGVPSNYVSSFTIAGFLFTFADMKSQSERNTKKDVTVIVLVTISGFFSLIGLPILITQIPILENTLSDLAEYLGLLSVALVLTTINFNRSKSSNKITVNKEEWEHYQKLLKEMKNFAEAYEKEKEDH